MCVCENFHQLLNLINQIQFPSAKKCDNSRKPGPSVCIHFAFTPCHWFQWHFQLHLKRFWHFTTKRKYSLCRDRFRVDKILYEWITKKIENCKEHQIFIATVIHLVNAYLMTCAPARAHTNNDTNDLFPYCFLRFRIALHGFPASSSMYLLAACKSG